MSVSRSRDYNKSLQKQDHDDNNDNGQKSPASFVMSTLLSGEREVVEKYQTFQRIFPR